MPICEAGNPVLWSTLQSLMVGAMAAAETLGVTDDVEDPTEDTESIWSIPEPIQTTFAQTFLLGPDNVTVTRAYLAPSLGAFGAWVPPNDAIKPLAEDRELVFISEEDGCWCKTMWRVVVDGAGLTLEATGEDEKSFGCCPTIPVPVPGDALDYSQVWMPAAHMVAVIAKPGRPRNLEVPKCIAVAGGCLFRITSEGLIAVQRELTGKLTWIIKPKHFQDIIDKLEEISAASGGAKLDKVRKASIAVEDAEPARKAKLFLCEMARVKVRDILFTLRVDDELEELTEPGCLDLPESECDIKFPWVEATCEGETCEESDSLKVYCNTLKILDILVARLEQYLNPKDFINDCELTVEDERTGQMVQCEYRKHVSPLFEGLSTYDGGGELPEHIHKVENSFEVDQCNTTVCILENEMGRQRLFISSARYRVFVMYLEDLYRASYNVWLEYIADKAKKLSCFSYWSFQTAFIPNVGEDWETLDEMFHYHVDHEPIIQPELIGDFRTSCAPAATQFLAGQRTRIGGPIRCGQILEGLEDEGSALGGGLGEKGTNAAIIMGYKQISVTVDSEATTDTVSGSCAYEEAGDYDIESDTLDVPLPAQISVLTASCLWPDRYMEEPVDPPIGGPFPTWWFSIHYGGSTPAYPTLFDHECDNEI